MRVDPRARVTLGAIAAAALVFGASACEPPQPTTFEELAQAHLDANAAHRLVLRAGG